MNGWFSRAAIDRIAECAMSPTARAYPGEQEPERITGALMLDRYAAANPWHGLGKERRLFLDRMAGELFGTESEIAGEFYSFAGLLELAISAGYVDLGAWDKTAKLAEVVQVFLAREAASEAPADSTLLQALALRLEEQRYRVGALQPADFNAFASLLTLDRAVRTDGHARTFLEACHSRPWPGDLAFLVTAEQFAARLAEESHNEKQPGVIRGGLATLRAFVSFGEIVDRVRKNEVLAEGFIRGVRWVQQAGHVHDRISTWAERLAEWAVGAGAEPGEAAWEEARVSLIEVEVKVERIWPSPRKPVAIAPEVDDRIGALIAEGRVGGALRLARDEAERRGKWFQLALGKPGADIQAQNLLTACQRLDELGDAPSAAVILAPHLEQLRAHLHGIHFKDAAAILARARLTKTISEPSPIEEPRSHSSLGKSANSPPLKSKHA